MNQDSKEASSFISCFNTFKDKNLFIDINDKKISYGGFFNSCLKLKKILDKKIKKNSKIFLISNDTYFNFQIVIVCLISSFILIPIDPAFSKERLIKLKKIFKPEIIIKKKTKIKNFSSYLGEIKYNFSKKIKKSDFIIVLTSGTTGEPKGILFNNQNYLLSAKSFSELAGYNYDTVVYHCLPTHYNAGILNTFLSCVFSGSSIVIGRKINFKSLINFWERPKKFNCNSIHLTPTIVASLLKLTSGKLEIKEHIRLYKSIITTGSYLYPSIQENFYKTYKKRIQSVYGVTEIGGPITMQRWEDTFEESSVGTHHKNVKIKLKKENEGKKNILIKTNFMMQGYFTSKGLQKINLNNKYFNTGDLGDYKKGILYFFGRNKDIIKKSGELIALKMIENTALKNKLVESAAAIGVQDELYGEKIYLFLKLHKISDLTNDIKKVNLYLAKKLKSNEIPNKIILIPKIPITSSGKILKDQLVSLYI